MNQVSMKVNRQMDRETYDPSEIPLNITMLKVFRHAYYS
jgi:hypothetical protein